MERIVVHVTTLEQWKSVLDVWFKQGYTWEHFYKWDYLESVFSGSSHYLHLDDYISQTPVIYGNNQPIEYSEFMAQNKEDNKMETYYVTKEQLDFLNTTYEAGYSLDKLLDSHVEAKNMLDEFSMSKGNAVLRYLGGDTSVAFKVKEPLYRLYRADGDDRIYMRLNDFGTPIWTAHKDNTFTAPLEEIKKWKTPAWEIERAE